MEPSSLIQFLTYTAILLSSIFIPILAKELGAGAFEVGLIVSAYYFFYLVANLLFSYFSDRFGGKVFLRLGLLLSTFAFAFQILARNVPSLLLVRIFAGFTSGVFPAALAVYAYEEREGKMGKFAGYGSLGWAVGSVISGIIAAYNPIFILSAIFFLIAFSVSLTFSEETPVAAKFTLPAFLFPWLILKENQRIYLPYFLRNVGAHAIWAIFPLYLLQLGADKFWIGIIYFVNAFSQFFIMQYVERFRNLFLINLGLLCSAVTFLGFALVPSYHYIIPVQVLLAFSFSTLQVGSIQELLAKNISKSSAIGVLNSMVNFSAVLGPFFAGMVAQAFGYTGVMYFGLILALIGLFGFTKVF